MRDPRETFAATAADLVDTDLSVALVYAERVAVAVLTAADHAALVMAVVAVSMAVVVA